MGIINKIMMRDLFHSTIIYSMVYGQIIETTMVWGWGSTEKPLNGLKSIGWWLLTLFCQPFCGFFIAIQSYSDGVLVKVNCCNEDNFIYIFIIAPSLVKIKCKNLNAWDQIELVSTSIIFSLRFIS